MFASALGKARSNSKVGVEVDQAGNEVVVETREDEGQGIKYQEIIDLLVAAGYFRARIKGLSSFDKVVGGMTWCITNCTFAIDIDLLFQENSTIGQKIALTEKIVAVLRKMACPNRIEPHQIQGQDFKSIFPVIQWLVKKVIETREVMGDHRRAYSISQFDKQYKIPGENDAEQLAKINGALSAVKHHYRPVRKFKRVGDKDLLTTQEAKVSSTLLEYGRVTVVQGNKDDSGKMEASKDKTKLSKAMQAVESAFAKVNVTAEGGVTEEEDEEEKIRIAQEKTLQKLMGGMSEMSGREVEGKVASRVVGSIVGMQSNEIQEISHTFAKKKAEIEEAASKKLIDPIEELRQGLERLNEVKTERNKENEQVQQQLDVVLAKKHELREVVQEKVELREAIETEFERLDEIEQSANKTDVKKIRELVMLNEKMKKDEVEFKSNCKQDLVKLKQDITDLKSQIQHREEVGTENDELVKKQFETDTERLSKVRLALAAKNRRAATLSRKIDEIPTRAELTQYQKRFVELYDQIAVTHVETKQFYTMYNTLDDSRRYLEKEADLLDSIYDNFQAATGSSSSMLQYLDQFEKIVAGVKNNKMKVEQKKQTEKMKRDEKNEQFHNLLDTHRQYVKTIQEFQEECRKNDILISKLQ